MEAYPGAGMPADRRLGERGLRQWRPWWAANAVRNRPGYTVWTAAGLLLMLAGSVMSAVDLFTPRNACLAIIAITIVGFYFGLTTAQRRHPQVLDLPPRPSTPLAKALGSGAYIAGVGTWLALILMGRTTSWTPAVVFLIGATSCVALAIAAHRLTPGPAAGRGAAQSPIDRQL